MAKTAVTKQPTSSPPGTPVAGRDGARASGRNGRAQKPNGRLDEESLSRVEQALRAAAAGDFSIRLPGRRRDTLAHVSSTNTGALPSVKCASSVARA